MVTIEYRVQPEKRAEFVTAMHAVREMRRAQRRVFLGSSFTTRQTPRASSNASWTNRGSNICASTNASVSPIARFSSARSSTSSRANRQNRHHWLADREP
jgi:hypothetical protein